MKVFRGTDGDLEPVEMECEEFGHPRKTSTGEIMYRNTHFRTKEEAWGSIVKSVEAAVSLAGSEVLNCKQALRRAEERAGKAASEYNIVMENFRKQKG